MSKPKLINKKEKYSIHSKVGGVEIKEISEHFKVGGFIATSHLDSGFINRVSLNTGNLIVPDAPEGALIRDKIDKELIDTWTDELKDGVPRANKVSIRHDRSDPIVAGVADKETPKPIQLPDGEYGLYVDSILDQTHENFETTQHRLDIGTYDSFSIEFSDAKYDLIEHDDYIERQLHQGTVLDGYTLASRPMNEYAVRLKEIDIQDNLNIKTKEIITEEEIKMSEEEIKKPEDNPEPEVQEEAKESISVSKNEYKEILQFKELMAQKQEEAKMNSLKEQIISEVKEMNKNTEVKDKTAGVTNDAPVEVKEIKEYQDAVSSKYEMKSDGRIVYDKSVDMQFKAAAELADKAELTIGSVTPSKSKVDSRSFKNFQTNGRVLECKGLGIGTNQGTDYYLSAAELSDIFDPVIYNALNQMTTTWGILDKEDYSSKGNNLVQFTVKTGINTSLGSRTGTTYGFYTGNAVTTGNSVRLKVSTKFKKQQVGIEIDGDMIAAARGGPVGDVFAQEVKDSTEDLMEQSNRVLFAEKGAETDAQPIGFEYITDSAGNTTLYGITRTSTTQNANVFLNPDSAADTYINGASADVSITNLRAAKRQALKEGADLNNLFFVCDHIQGDKFRGIYDAIQRTAPTSSRFGFEGRLEIDGIPIFEDKDCNDDDWFLIDRATHKIAMWVPPTLEMLGKDSDSQKGFIKSYWCTKNRHPRRMVQIYGNATS